MGGIIGDEDCLFLNVYTPQVGPGSRPVMVWIPGGGFYAGSGNDDFYGGGYLLDEDIILVSINYRLTVFGFFSTEDEVSPGNYGLHDQVLALQWVQHNIAAFGGNSGSVTIFGESAGGISVHYLILSPLTTGLFHRAISQSGAVSCPWGYSLATRNLQLARKYANSVGCPTTSSKELMECLKKVDGTKLLKAVEKETEWDMFGVNPKPGMDPRSKRPFLPQDPFTIMKTGAFQKVPYMAGINRDEGSMMLAAFPMGDDVRRKELEENYAQLGPLSLYLDTASTKDPVAVSRQIRKFYLGDKSINEASLRDIIEMDGDRAVNVHFDQSLKLMSPHVPIYKYLFAYEGDVSSMQTLARLKMRNFSLELIGVSHGDDLNYLFTNLVPSLQVRGDGLKMKNLMVSLWTSFARTGVPDTSTGSLPAWPVFDMSGQKHMVLTLKRRMDFWRSLPLSEPWRVPQSPYGSDEL